MTQIQLLKEPLVLLMFFIYLLHHKLQGKPEELLAPFVKSGQVVEADVAIFLQEDPRLH